MGNKSTSKHCRSSKATPARKLAYSVLADIRHHRVFLDHAWNSQSKRVSLPPAERAFARLLATEVISHKGSLDELINRVLKDPHDIQPDVRDALRISFAELFYLGKQHHIVVNEGVELVRSVAPKASGVANYVLHRACELHDTFPFGDPNTDEKAASLAYGFPTWLTSKLSSYYGLDKTLHFLRNSNEPAPFFFVINQAHANGPQTLKALVNQGIKVAPISRIQQNKQGLSCFIFAKRSDVGHPFVVELLRKGTLIISDGAAQSIAAMAVPLTFPNNMLEIGAGRGTKSILMQNVSLARFGKQMNLDTLDLDARRTKERIARLKQAKIAQGHVFCQSACDLSNFSSESYDAVFIDAPCSGLGTLRRHADIRWRIAPKDIKDFAHNDSEMLRQAARLVKSGGQLTYATCTVTPQENDQVIDAFLESSEGASFRVVKRQFFSDLFSNEASGPLFDGHYVSVFNKYVS